MNKRIFLIVLVILLMIPVVASAKDADVYKQNDSGTEVYSIQRRLCELGYLNYRPTGKYSNMTTAAVQKFQSLNGIGADGQVGASTYQKLFSESAVRNKVNPSFKTTIGRAYTGEVTQKGQLSSWEEISKKFKIGDEVEIKDYNTGRTYFVRRTGGIGCAQVVTVSSDDFDVYTAVFGGGETWEHRPVLVSIDGTAYAGSIFGMPTNMDPTSESGMKGYTILSFNNSKSDVGGLPDEEHMVSITQIAE